MAIQTTYTHARANLAALCDAVTADREVVIIQRRNAEDVALIAAAELDSLLEATHLLRSPKNAAGTSPSELLSDFRLGENTRARFARARIS